MTTNAIENGKLRLTQMAVGESIEGTILETTQGVHSPLITLKLANGEEVVVFTAGNVKKFFNEDAAKGKYDAGRRISITRKEDRVFETSEGTITTTAFSVFDLDKKANARPTFQAKTAAKPAVAAAPVSNRSKIEEELKAIRSNVRK